MEQSAAGKTVLPLYLRCLACTLQSLNLSAFGIKGRNLLAARMEITPYNSHEGFS
jgi:hypothetical protein